MQFKINPSDIRLLLNTIEDSSLVAKIREVEQAGQHIEKDKYPTGRYLLILTEAETETILDALSDFIMNSGLEENGEPNPLGRQAELLLDIFSDD